MSKDMNKMLDLISLGTIEKIFHGHNVPSRSKSLYINCLIKHFKDKDATEENAQEFIFKTADIPNYKKFYPMFCELHEAQLVKINHGHIIFQNKWGQFIDRTRLSSEDLGKSNKPLLDFENDLKSNSSMIDVVGMKNKLSRNQVCNLIKIFLLEQDATQSSYKDLGELSKHFIYWVNANKDKISMENEVIKSKGKILGLE